MAPKFTLIYFDFTGRAEPIRMAFKFGNIDFVDERISKAKWPEIKPSLPNGQVPCLKFDSGEMMCQSAAILQFVSKLAGLYPEDPFEAAKSTEIMFLFEDIQSTISNAIRNVEDDAGKAKAVQNLTQNFFPNAFKNLNTVISKNAVPGFSSGHKYSFSDIVIYCMVDAVKSNMMGLFPEDVTKQFDAIQAVYQKVADEPKFFTQPQA